jgi:ribosomal protein L32
VSLYGYRRDERRAEFELLVSFSDTPQCPSCASQKLTRQVSRVCGEIKYPAIARSWRRAAADLSNFSEATPQTGLQGRVQPL